MADSKAISLSILEREYRVNCPADAEPQLRAAAAELNQRMAEIKQASTASGTAPALDRIAVIAALNIAHELLALRTNLDGGEQRIQHMHQQLDEVLAEHQAEEAEPS